MHYALRAILLPLGLLLASCASLPAAAPTAGQVTGGIGPGDVEVIDIGPATPSGQPANYRPLPEWTLGDAPPQRTGVTAGDELDITVYEVGYSLFSGNGPGATSAQATGAGHKFPPLRVADDGTIRLPFVGTLTVFGLTGDQIAKAVEDRLRGQSQFAQVVVGVKDGPRRSVIVSGDVKQPGRVALTDANERLLDAIALALGPEARMADTLVELTRGNATSVARLDSIAASSPQNVALAPGDRIALTRSIRSITVLGAAKSVSEIGFDGPVLTLSEALARAGGLIEDQSDPAGVFIFRQEIRQGERGAVVMPVIYRLNLLEPSAYFAAQNFDMREQDVMLIANASSNKLEKFLQMVNGLATPIVTVDLLAR